LLACDLATSCCHKSSGGGSTQTVCFTVDMQGYFIHMQAAFLSCALSGHPTLSPKELWEIHRWVSMTAV